MVKIGRNDPCPCGSGKKYKQCCLGKDAERAAGKVVNSYNKTGLAEFHGLSPDEMQRLMSQPFSSPDHVEFPAMLDTEPVAPVATLFKSLVDGIGDGVKATTKGNLPLRVVNAAAKTLAEDIPGELPPRGSVGTEDNFLLLHDTRKLSEVAGLIHATGKKFTLTKKCRDLLAGGGMRSVYPVLLQTYAREFNWAYRDGDDDLRSIQHTFMFTLYLLTLYGDEYRPVGFYEDAFIAAFPMVEREVTANEYRSSDVVVRDAYTLRALTHFANYFGLAEIRRQPADYETEIKATPLLADAVRFNSNVGNLDTVAPSRQAGPRREWQGKRISIGYIEEEKMFAFKEVWMALPDEEIAHLDDVVDKRGPVSQSFIAAVEEHRPEGLCVSDSQWAEQLRAALPGVPIRVGPTPRLDEFADGLQEHLAKIASGSGAVPYLMADIDSDAMGRLFESLAALYKAEPWEYMEDWQFVNVDIPALDIEDACISVIGAVSRDFGFLLFSSLGGYMKMVNSSDEMQQGAPLDLGEDFMSVNYLRGADLPKDNREEIRRNNWQVAGSHAYPMLIHHGPDGGPLSLTLRDVRILEACAMALAALVAKWGEGFRQQDHPPIEEVFEGPDGMEIFVGTPAGPESTAADSDLDVDSIAADYESVDELWELDHQVSQRIQAFTQHNWPELFTQDLKRFASTDQMAYGILVTLYSATVEGKKTPADLFVESQPTDQQERDWIAAQSKSWFSLWEVIDTDDRHRVRLRDRLTGEERTVFDPNLTVTFEVIPGMHLLARIVDTDECPVIVSLIESVVSVGMGRELEDKMFKHLRRKNYVDPAELRKPKTARYLIKQWFEYTT